MGFLDSIKSKVGEENFNKIESQAQGFLGGEKKQQGEEEQKKEGKDEEPKKDTEESKEEAPKTEERYVDKLENLAGKEKVDQIKNKVGEANFKKAEDVAENQIKSRFGGQGK
jgi:hypothetical protein